MTILQKIQSNENDCLGNPSLLSEYLLTLASHIIEADKQKFEAEVKYAHKWNEMRPTVESDRQCDMKLKLEPEYIELKSKESLCRTVIETIRAVKKRLAFLSLEYNELT